MNAHIPQSYEAATELEEIAALKHHIVTPRHAKPLIGVFQDTLIGSYLLTRPGNEFTRREFMNLMTWNKRFDGVIPEPKAAGGKKYTGQQVLSALLPAINMEMGNKSYDGEKESKESNNYVKIVEGNIQQGIIDDDIYMKPGKGIIHMTYNDFGPEETIKLLDSLQTTIEGYLVLNGFSVGISDLVADDTTKSKIVDVIQQKKKRIDEILLQVHTDLFDNNTGKTNQQEFEDQVFGVLNQATDEAGKAGKKSLAADNRLVAMVNAGSKGNTTNIAQMIACLGQQSIEGKRIPYGFTDRTLPHYKKYDDSAEARGFIESSFIRGLTPQEFFFHAMSGREGLIDTAVKTADTGYIQRQLVKAMEDLVVQHDGTVRDANSNIIQRHYGEDGIMATKIEAQAIHLGKLSHSDIRKEFGMDGVDLTNVLKEDVDMGDSAKNADALSKFIDEVLTDQKMLVEGVFQSRSLDASSVYAPVNLARLILNTRVRFGIKSDQKTDLTPVYVLSGITRLIERTQTYNKIWSALLRFYLAPHKLIVKERMTKNAFDTMCEIIIVSHMKAWAQPGEQVGIVAAQSIGEPSTQMSMTSSTIICIKNKLGKNFYGKIGKFIDSLLTANSKKVIQIGNRSVVLNLDKSKSDQYSIIGVSNDEKTSWKPISQISRHPANGGLVEVVVRSGRKTTATMSHSFLTRSINGIVPIQGSKLEIGMRIPIARYIPEVPDPLMFMVSGESQFELTKDFGWLCGIYLANGIVSPLEVYITNNESMVEEKLAALSTLYNWKFSTKYYLGDDGPSKSNTICDKDLAFFLQHHFKTDSYDKEVGGFVFHSNTQFISGIIGGYFDGNGYLDTVQQQIRTGSINKKLTEQMMSLLGYCGIFGTMTEETLAIQTPDNTLYTLNILKEFSRQYKESIGFSLPEKAAALDSIMVICMEHEDKHDTSSDAYDKIPGLGEVIAETGRLLRMPGHDQIYDIWTKKESIGRKTLQLYIQGFKEMVDVHVDESAVQQVAINIAILESAVAADIVWDEIVDLVYHVDPQEYVYDFTVPGNDTFMVDCNILVHNTLNVFHYAGVASSSNVTRGVPRLRELLKVTKNPKASSLTIHMKPEYHQSKEKARELIQDLELTLLRHITDKLAIYWDPTDDATIVEEDRKMISFYKMYEHTLLAEEGGSTTSQSTSYDKWVLRLELNREKMFNKNITMADVVFVIKYQFDDVGIVYSDYNSDKLVMRIRLPLEEITDTASKLDDFTNLKKFQNKLLNSIVIRGIPGIKAVTFRKDEQKVQLVDDKYIPVTQYILDTDGTNYMKVMNHPSVDANKLYTTNVHDVLDILGIEAVRAILHNEIATLFEGVGVNYRHLGLLCDIITHTGRLMSIDRYGINKNDIGPLAKASFEETEKIILKAALFGEVDPVTGVSANIMMGQPIRGGTAFSQIVLDESAFIKLSEGMETYTKDDDDEEEEGDITSLIEDSARIDPCSSAAFQANMNISALPIINIMEEDSVGIDIIE